MNHKRYNSYLYCSNSATETHTVRNKKSGIVGITGRWSHLLILLLPLFSFLTGCGPTPEEALKNHITELQNAAINSMFAEKIMENPEATAYVVPNSELILIAGGEKQISSTYNEIYHGAAYYNVSRITCTATAAYNGLKEYKKKPFTHKARLQVNFQIKMYETDLDKNSNGTPGLEFHTLSLDQDFSRGNKEKWLEIRRNEIPESQYNHAVAIHRISQYQPSTYTESRSFEIFYNPKTEQWEFSSTVKQLTTTTPPPSYSEKDHETIMKGYKRKKFTARSKATNETVILWVRAEDYDTLDKILNQDLMKVNGVWKKRTIVEHTEELRKAINAWNKKETVSLNDLEQILLKPIQKCTDAENREDAIALAKKAMMGIFLKQPEGTPTDRDQRRFQNAINFIKNTPSASILNREELLDLAQKELNYIDNYLKEQEKREAERKAEEAKRLAEEKAQWEANRAKHREMILKLQHSIENFKTTKNLDNLLQNLKQYVDYKKASERFNNRNKRKHNNISYDRTMHRIEKIAAIASGHSSALRELYQNRGYCFNYRFLADCRKCGSSGLKSCRACGNSGRCPDCGGSGQKRISVGGNFGGGRLYSSHGNYVSCPRACRFCRGRTLKCHNCSGQGRTLNKYAIKQALDKELIKIQSVLHFELKELKK